MRFTSRRDLLQSAALGFGGLALNSILQREALAAGSALAKERTYDLKPKPTHFPAKAKNVIFIYVGGGPSTIDMFDPKPALLKYDGKPAPFEIKGRALNGSQQIMASPWKFQQLGQHGRQVSDLLPYFQKVVDQTTFVRSMTTDRIDHSTAQFTFVTGANVLVAIFGEKDSHAVYFLHQKGITRLDVVNYISHGITKVPQGTSANKAES